MIKNSRNGLGALNTSFYEKSKCQQKPQTHDEWAFSSMKSIEAFDNINDEVEEGQNILSQQLNNGHSTNELISLTHLQRMYACHSKKDKSLSEIENESVMQQLPVNESANHFFLSMAQNQKDMKMQLRSSSVFKRLSPHIQIELKQNPKTNLNTRIEQEVSSMGDEFARQGMSEQMNVELTEESRDSKNYEARVQTVEKTHLSNISAEQNSYLNVVGIDQEREILRFQFSKPLKQNRKLFGSRQLLMKRIQN